jgi:hypothetical protein
MRLPDVETRSHHQNILNRFVAACQDDERVMAAFLVGSYVNGMADPFSDIDFYLFVADEMYEEFCHGRAAFIHRLGNPLFLEDFDNPGVIFFIFPDGAEGELTIGRASQLPRLLYEPYRVLLDKKNLLAETEFTDEEVEPADMEPLRRQIQYFWHELSHFIVALGRGQLYWAQGQLGALRTCCLNLARLQQDLADEEVGEEGYFKVDTVLPVEQLAPLQSTYCALEPSAMLQAAYTILRFYQELARPLAQTYHIPYPTNLERLMASRLEALSNSASGRR